MVDGVHRADKLGMGMQRIVKFFGFQYLLASQNDQLLIYGQTQDLIHGQKLAFAYGVTFPILWSPLGQLHFVVDLGIGAVGDCNLSGSVRNHTGRDIVGAAHEQGGVCIADDFYPLVIGIAVLQLTQPLQDDGDAHPPGTDNGASSSKSMDLAAVHELFPEDVDWDRKLTARAAVGIADQFDKEKGKKEGGQELKGGVLIGGDAEIGTELFPRQGQIDLRKD